MFILCKQHLYDYSILEQRLQDPSVGNFGDFQLFSFHFFEVVELFCKRTPMEKLSFYYIADKSDPHSTDVANQIAIASIYPTIENLF